MRPFRISSIFFCAISLLNSVAASVAVEPKQAVALWLSQQLHRPIEASQILVSPVASALQGCTITRVRPVPTGATSLSLRCPAHVLPQLVLLNLSVAAAAPLAISAVPPIVRAGATLRADWRTDFMHAVLPVVAIDSGAAGAEIRVRVANTSRIMRARILSAHTVTIVVSGA